MYVPTYTHAENSSDKNHYIHFNILTDEWHKNQTESYNDCISEYFFDQGWIGLGLGQEASVALNFCQAPPILY
jgi:hypothetical protein